MSDKPRDWPNVQRAYRDMAAEQACKGIRALGPVMDGRPMVETERIRRVGVGLAALLQIARCMELAGAPTRPVGDEELGLSGPGSRLPPPALTSDR